MASEPHNAHVRIRGMHHTISRHSFERRDVLASNWLTHVTVQRRRGTRKQAARKYFLFLGRQELKGQGEVAMRGQFSIAYRIPQGTPQQGATQQVVYGAKLSDGSFTASR